MARTVIVVKGPGEVPAPNPAILTSKFASTFRKFITIADDCRSGVASSIPARSHTFVEFDHEIISTVILLPSAESFKKGCCQLQAKVCARSTG